MLQDLRKIAFTKKFQGFFLSRSESVQRSSCATARKKKLKKSSKQKLDFCVSPVLKTPKFWLGKTRTDWLISWSLLPFSWLYRFSFWLNCKLTKTKSVKIPVICVGNLIAGGAGKTPTALALGRILLDLGINFCYLSKGYGGIIANKSSSNCYFFEKNCAAKKEAKRKITAKDFGDEALLLNELAPIMIGKNRFIAAKEIVAKSQFKAILMDDGFQNFSLHQDLKILVIDGQIGFGNGLILPSGPLRQSLESGCADLVFVVGKANPNLEKQLQKLKNLSPIFEIKVVAKNLQQFLDKKILAFCGLAYPQKFFSFLVDQGLKVKKTLTFPDHHFFSDDELSKIVLEAEKMGYITIATKKDWVKFPSEFKQKIAYLDIDFELENKNLVIDMLKKVLLTKIANA